MKYKFTIFLFFVLFATITAQENKQKLSLSGFIKSDFFYDSRQTTNLREGHFLLFPKRIQEDSSGSDLNAKPSFNFLSIQTRLTLGFSEINAFGAKASGLIEGSFFGNSESDINEFRLRHAFVKLNWDKTKLLLGQYWHPMFVPEVFPGVLSFNTGVPFQPFSRNPQIRFEQSYGDFNFIIAALSQRDFSSLGPAGASSSYLRNSGVPNLHFQIQQKDETNVFGFGVDFKKLTPKIVNAKNLKTDNSISSISYLAYVKTQIDNFTAKVEGIYAENPTDLIMIGGYSVKSIDPVTSNDLYENLRTISFWGDFLYGKNIQIGTFIGYSKNLGAKENISKTIYSRESSIANIFRISPRIVFKSNNLTFGSEFEFTSAAYGTPDDKGIPVNLTNAANSRILFTAIYNFNF